MAAMLERTAPYNVAPPLHWAQQMRQQASLPSPPRARDSPQSPLEAAQSCCAEGLEEADRACRTVCCWPCFRVGLRRVYPSDPFFEGTILDHFRVAARNPGKPRLSEAEARHIKRKIEAASPRIPIRLCPDLACTSDAWLCGLVPATAEAREGFRVIRKVSVNRRTGRVLLTVWPEFEDVADCLMHNLKGIVEPKLIPIVMDRTRRCDYHVVEAVPVDSDLVAKEDCHASRRIPMATVLRSEEETEPTET